MLTKTLEYKELNVSTVIKVKNLKSSKHEYTVKFAWDFL